MRQKDLLYVLIRHEDELDSIKTILQQLNKQEHSDLDTASLGVELTRLQQVQHDLPSLLKELDPRSKTKINQFARQLLEGSADEKKLSSIMDELAQIKVSILPCIQMAKVGMNKQIVVDAAKTERIDSNLQKELEQLDDYEGLRPRSTAVHLAALVFPRSESSYSLLSLYRLAGAYRRLS
jgi:hypothetical protein